MKKEIIKRNNVLTNRLIVYKVEKLSLNIEQVYMITIDYNRLQKRKRFVFCSNSFSTCSFTGLRNAKTNANGKDLL